ncbi:hypothetical protein PhCBS80983_g00348 [Powellomyces hirtus]|uniref:Fungal lipase-type domain-containing protein n=1 Tax=Powellomyces hirtus TaxID=109895 RepID=A0A507EH10_9FUNG|nr:hypothetical protein PhCBS80983_g00348 [Powellomyces hirtus]
MVHFRPIAVVLAIAALGVQASPAIQNLQPRASPQVKARNAQQIRLDFMSDAIGYQATPDMIADLNAGPITNVIKTKASPARKANKSPEEIAVKELEDMDKPAPSLVNAANGEVITGAVLNLVKSKQLYAAAAYCLNGLDDWTCRERCPKGIKLVKAFDDIVTNSVCYVAYSLENKEIIVSYRGTASIRSFVTDLQLYKADADYGLERIPTPKNAKVHSGFLVATTVTSKGVHEAIEQVFKQFGRDFTISVVGHSLGGAIGILSSIELYDWLGEAFAKRIKVFTYGQPRVGNQIWADWVETLPFAKDIYRITHDKDIVPHLPPTLLSFRHHQDEIWINSKGTLLSCDDDKGEARNCANSVVALSVIDHLTGYFAVPFGPWC